MFKWLLWEAPVFEALVYEAILSCIPADTLGRYRSLVSNGQPVYGDKLYYYKKATIYMKQIET